MTSDSEAEYKYSNINSKKIETKTEQNTLCPDGELRCVNGHCITVSQLCDKVKKKKLFQN